MSNTTIDEIKELHSRAMEFVNRSFLATGQDNHEEAAALLRDAYALEREAALKSATLTNFEPTRSILLRSAAYLAKDCDAFDDAERLACMALAGNPPLAVRREVRNLLSDIHFFVSEGVSERSLRASELDFALYGVRVGGGIAPYRMVSQRIDAIEKIVIRIAERMSNLRFRTHGPPSAGIASTFNLYISVPRAASYAVTLRFGGRDAQLGLLPNQERVLREVVDCMEALEHDDYYDTLMSRIGEERYVNNFITLAKNVMPDAEASSVMLAKQRSRPLLLRKQRSTVRVLPSTPPSVLIGRLIGARESESQPYDSLSVKDFQTQQIHTVRVERSVIDDVVQPYFRRSVKMYVTHSEDNMYFQDVEKPSKKELSEYEIHESA